jgi:hypothetical protein
VSRDQPLKTTVHPCAVLGALEASQGMTVTAETRLAAIDSRTAEQFARDRRAVEGNLSLWSRLRHDTDARRQRLREWQSRRRGRPGVLQFDIVPLGPSAEFLAVRGELLIRREDADCAAVRRSGLRARPVGCLDGRVVRLVGRPGATAETLAGLRRQGVPVSHSHVTAMNAWIKGLDGPAPADSPRAFPGGSHKPGVAVAVIDSGIAADRRADGWLRAVVRDRNVDPLGTVGRQRSLDAGAGHGTFVAGVVQQVAPDVDIRMYRAVDSGGIGSEVEVACAMVRAAGDGASVINLSVGTQSAADEAPVALTVAMQILAERYPQVLVVAAAGNDGDTRPCWPAALPGVVAVAGLTAGGRSSVWSSRGDWVDCAAVGEGVVSTYVAGRKGDAVFGADAWACWTGTSFAAPQVAGAVARACADSPGMTPRAALAQLTTGVPRLTGFGHTVGILPGT